MGVKDEFHQKAILVCIDELCQRSTSKESELLVVTANGNDGDSSGHTGQTPPHRMVESSFQSLERCDKCHKFLRGLLHQGLICHCKSHLSWLHLKAVHLTVDRFFFNFCFLFFHETTFTACGLIAHRTCSATGLPACLQGLPERANRLHNRTGLLLSSLTIFLCCEHVVTVGFIDRIFSRTVFGVGLCRLSTGSDPTSVPTVVLRLVQEIEQRATTTPSLDLYRLYRTTTPSAETIAQLCLQLSTDPGVFLIFCQHLQLGISNFQFVLFTNSCVSLVLVL